MEEEAFQKELEENVKLVFGKITNKYIEGAVNLITFKLACEEHISEIDLEWTGISKERYVDKMTKIINRTNELINELEASVEVLNGVDIKEVAKKISY